MGMLELGRRGTLLRLAIIGLCVLAIGGRVGDAYAEPTSASEGLVDVGGYRLFVRCMGHGSPTVILEAALGNSSQTWSGIQPAVGDFTRVCVYDRAGMGRSDPAPRPRTSQDMVDDLRTLLDRAEIPGPYVLVGHSFGGFNVQLLARQDGGVSVVGTVLVDATPAQWIQVSDQLGLPVPSPQQNPEGVDIRASATQVLTAPTFPDVPLIALGRTIFTPPPPATLPPGYPLAEVSRRWTELQAAHAALSSRGELRLVDGARHFIHLDRPEVVIDAIADVVASAQDLMRPGQGCGDPNHFHDKVDCKSPVGIA